MQFLVDHARFLRTLFGLLVLYVLWGYVTGYDLDALALGLVVLGVAAFLFIAYRFQDDFAPESER
jgi:hypothetical protein